MRMIFLYILFAFLGQQITDNGQHTLSTVVEPVEAQIVEELGIRSEELGIDSVAEPVEAPGDVVVPSTSSGTCTDTLNVSTYIICNKDVCDTSLRSDSVTYYKSQLLIADSLYKNYLPQYNFEEIKGAVAFFERTSGLQELRTSGTQGPRNPEIQNSGDPEFLSACAKAHYYHAVGLTERDDIVGACEHYLRALEIMEEYWTSGIQDFRTSGSQKSRDPEIQNPEIRFLALTYTRLGRLFLNENYCDLAITKYRKALKYVEMIGEKSFKVDLLKFLGNSYQLSNKLDSALYYYNESLKYNSSLPNKLDVEKSIAQILFYEGERDSAYRLVKSNLDNLVDCSSKYSYYYTLGDMYFNDMLYDSAIYYLEKSYVCDNYSIKAAASTKLSAIYESLGNFEMKAFYDSDIVKLSVENANNDVKSAKLQNVYDNYTKRKLDREKVREKKRVHDIVISLISIMILMLILMLLIRKIYRTRHNELLYSLNEKEKDIANKNIIIDNITEEIISEKSKNNSYQKIIDDNNNDIIFIENELNRLREQLSYTKQVDVNSYYETEICKNIMYQIAYKNNNKVKSTKLKTLKAKDIISLKYAANAHLNNILERISSKYPKIDNEDLVCICLLLLDINITDMSELLDKSYNAVWRRMNKIKAIFDISSDSNLQSFLLSII